MRFTGQETRYPCALGGKYEIDKEQLVAVLRACRNLALGARANKPNSVALPDWVRLKYHYCHVRHS